MSRSRPTDTAKNPSVRWFEWNAGAGVVRFYDKDAKQNVEVPLPFTFLLLDELSTVKGWHDHSGSGIYSNEVRDTRTEWLTVKAFKGGLLAEGLYRDIKDQVNRQGGSYVAQCYIGVKGYGPPLAIAAIGFKGAALGVWMEFRKQARSELYTKAIKITGYDEGKKGRVVFRLPIFELVKISDEMQDASKDLDATLQVYLTDYLARTRHETQDEEPDEEPTRMALPNTDSTPLDDSDIPF